MVRAAVCGLPVGLSGLLKELAAARSDAGEHWILRPLQEYGASVINTLWRMLGREQDVLDAYQNVVCQLAARGPGRIGANRAAYLYRSAINAAIEQMRRRKREREHLGRFAEGLDSEGRMCDGDSDPASDGETERLRKAILGLPGQLRDVIVLHDLSGLDYRRVAGIMNITPGTARVYRRHAIVRLAKSMA